MLSITHHGLDSYVRSVVCKLHNLASIGEHTFSQLNYYEISILISLLVPSHANSWARLWCVFRITGERSTICDIFLTKCTHCAVSNWPNSKEGDPGKWTQCLAYWPSQFCVRFPDPRWLSIRRKPQQDWFYIRRSIPVLHRMSKKKINFQVLKEESFFVLLRWL